MRDRGANRGRSRMATAALLICLSPTCVAASGVQGSEPDVMRLQTVEFAGLEHFTPQEAIAESGLVTGAPITPQQLQQAANTLAKSGAFDSVAFQYTRKGSQLSVQFRVAETKKMVPRQFENFVWFTQADLDGTLEQRVPFYGELIPEGGHTVEEIQRALRQLLRTNGIPGDVEAIPFVKGIGQNVSAIQFRVTGVQVQIKELSFPGASAVTEAQLRKAAARDLMGSDFSLTTVDTVAADLLVPLYRKDGYLGAVFAEPQATLLTKSLTATQVDVAVAVPVTEGIQYKWLGESWAGNHAMPSPSLDHWLGMKSGAVADGQQLQAGLESIRHEYLARGYVDVSLEKNLLLDPATRSATCRIEITEGPQYRMGGVSFSGVSDKSAKQLGREWKIRPGQIYDANYAGEFLRNTASKLARLGVPKGNEQLSVERNSANATVDVRVSFTG